MRQSERVTVTMPSDQADALRKLVDSGGAESVSSYVAQAVRDRLARDEALVRLEQRFGRPEPDALAWARQTLGVETVNVETVSVEALSVEALSTL